MEYISKTQIINHFSRFRIGDDVILIKDIRGKSDTIKPPVYGTITAIDFINKKAAISLPKYRRSDITRLRIDPDLLVYTFTSWDNSFYTKVFEHAVIEDTNAHRALSESNCLSLYRSRHKQFKSIIKARQKARITKNGIRAIIMLAFSIWLTISTFSKDHWLQSVLFFLAYLMITAIVFAITNRHIQRIHTQ